MGLSKLTRVIETGGRGSKLCGGEEIDAVLISEVLEMFEDSGACDLGAYCGDEEG